MIGTVYEQSLLDSFLDGGPFVMLTLPFVLIWLIVTIQFCRGRYRDAPWILFAFPFGFGFYAFCYWVLSWHFSYEKIFEQGVPDSQEYAYSALATSRATLWILAEAVLSFVSAGVLIFWFQREKKEIAAT